MFQGVVFSAREREAAATRAPAAAFLVVDVAPGAARLSSVGGRDTPAAQDVFGIRRWLGVRRIHTRPRARRLPGAGVEPEVIEDETGRDRPDEKLIGNAVSVSRSPIAPIHAVPVGVLRCEPRPALTRPASVDLRPEALLEGASRINAGRHRLSPSSARAVSRCGRPRSGFLLEAEDGGLVHLIARPNLMEKVNLELRVFLASLQGRTRGVGGNLLVLDRGEELFMGEFRDVRHGSSLQKARAVIGIAHRIRSDGTRGLFGLRVVNLEGLHGTTLVALVCVTAPAALTSSLCISQ